ncbi:MAG TPA: hypothetical protein VD902_14975 [Symbiobacteriaceae bacterium]|nr:hypothetical protein [Symbiobacteriaceae bacterium]
MLSVDWLGLGLTFVLLSAILGGRLWFWRALLTMLLADLGRLAVAAVTSGSLYSLTVGGAFTRMEYTGISHPAMHVAGIGVATLFAQFFSRRAARDMLLYALVAAGTTLYLREV